MPTLASTPRGLGLDDTFGKPIRHCCLKPNVASNVASDNSDASVSESDTSYNEGLPISGQAIALTKVDNAAAGFAVQRVVLQQQAVQQRRHEEESQELTAVTLLVNELDNHHSVVSAVDYGNALHLVEHAADKQYLLGTDCLASNVWLPATPPT